MEKDVLERIIRTKVPENKFVVYLIMESSEGGGMPRYGTGDFGTPSYEDRRMSGLPESYAVLVRDIVTDEVKKTGGIFLDVGGGTGELAKRIEADTGIKAVSIIFHLRGWQKVETLV